MTETYNVPVFYLDDLKKLIKKLERRGANVYCNIRERDSFVDKCDWLFDEGRKKVELVPVDLNVEFNLGEYNYIAEIEHTEKGNLIHAVGNEVIPTEYRTRCYCDHCNTSRKRRETYLFKKGDKFMQVGSSCINDFFNWNALSILEVMTELQHYNYTGIKVAEDDFFKGMYNNHYSNCYGTEDLINRFYQLILRDGYSTYEQNPKRFDDVFDGKIKVDHKYDKEVKDIINVVNTDWYNDKSDYCHNIKVMVELDIVENKNRAMLYSFVFSAINYLNKLNNNGGKYLGNIGDKIDCNVKSYRVLFTQGVQVSYYSSYLNITYKFVTENDDVILWTTNKELKGNIKHITGTIKDLKEYKCEKQTILTRCKVE